MKKEILNSKLSLNKKVISDLHTRKLKGGDDDPQGNLTDGDGANTTLRCGSLGGAPTCVNCTITY
ncbi:hypothetical protein GTQ40_09525 [Flavobacteriaceae bacterium R38]|nr:hypothetical protein [Flavobacteriaceae bacterium R38]